VICGLSWGGSIAQAFAAKNPERVKALILVSSAVAIDLTLLDKILCTLLVPKWLMMSIIKLLSPKNFIRFSLWLANITRGRHWLARKGITIEYLRQCMFGIDSSEYLKIWGAIYDFHLLRLEKIACPTLVINGEDEPANTLHHTREILHRVKHAQAVVIPAASHASNIDNPEAFNNVLETFLHNLPSF